MQNTMSAEGRDRCFRELARSLQYEGFTVKPESLDGEETARLLIDSGAGVVTPYGVVYDNGMKLEQYYNGHQFPLFL